MVGQSSSLKPLMVFLRSRNRLRDSEAIACLLHFRSAALDLAAEPKQRIFSGDQLAARLVDPLLLAVYEPPVRCYGLVDPVSGLRHLVVHLAGQPVPEPGPELLHPPAEVPLGLPALPGKDVEPAN